jgi:DGQHR domain-containing protein
MEGGSRSGGMIHGKSKKKKKKVLSARERGQNRIKQLHFREVRSIFSTCGFKRIQNASDKEFTFQGTTSDLDDVFVFENIIVLTECTTAQNDISGHLKRKKVLYDKILKDPNAFRNFLAQTFPGFAAAQDAKYQPHHFRTVILYCSRYPIEGELKDEVPGIRYLDYNIVRYFKAITDRVKHSARFELFSYLGLSYKDIGDAAIAQGTVPHQSYKGSILPEGQSHFPPGYKVASFYVDPAALLARCYVLRKDGWRDDAGLYQRMISRPKIESIRKYLLSKKRVFINNIIVTLPNSTRLVDDTGATLDPAKIHCTEPGNILLSSDYNSIGLIDGQHRVFSYYEGGRDENKISKLRAQQNLLVTGVIYPSNLSPAERSKFEATLFLEINATQTNAKSDLKQAIGILLQPFSQDSIARRIVNSLNERGPLNGEFERYFYDKGKIKTTSIVSYGLKQLTKLSGEDSLFTVWQHADKMKLVTSPTDILAEEYVDYCTSQINIFVSSVKASLPHARWTTDPKVRGRMLTTTVLNGLINCLRLIVENKKRLYAFDTYKSRFSGSDFGQFNFSSYKSSQYRTLGGALYSKYFE